MNRRGQISRWRRPTAERLDQLLALPMLVLTVAFLIVMVLPVLFPDLPPGARAALAATDMGIWAAFLAEYLARLLVAPNRRAFITHNVFDLLLVVIPVLRPLRLLRSARLLRAARLTRIGAAAGVAVRESRVRLASRTALLAAGSAAILILAAAVMELDVERAAAKANITTFGDALWWAVSTVATVGYGDHYPVTAAGRAIGIMLMIVGVGIFGVTAAAAAAWFVHADQEEDKRRQADTITGLTAEVAALRQTVSELRDALGQPVPRQLADARSKSFPGGKSVRELPRCQPPSSPHSCSVTRHAQLMVGPVATIPAIVLGYVARSQIRRTGEKGAGLALAGLLLGWAALILGILVIAVGLAISGGMHGPMP